jgi:hypothetical protein
MSVCFSTRSSLRGRQRKEREKGGKMSLFSLKKTLSFSLSLSFSFFLRYVMFWLSIRFFFPLFALRFQRWVRDQACWSSLSLFSLQGEIGNHIIRLSLSLSLSLTKRAFWKTRSPSRTLRGTQKERGMIISEKEEIDASDINSRAKEEEKKRWIGFLFSSCGTAATKSRLVASKTKTHERTNLCAVLCVTFRPPPRGMPPKFILPPLLYYIYMCVCVYSV